MEKDEQLFFRKTSDKTPITSVYKWIECFHVFVAIYAEKHSNEVPNLMAYGQIVQKIYKTSGNKAAIAYDESFRRWTARSCRKHRAIPRGHRTGTRV